MLNITLPAWGFPGSSVGKEPTSNAGDPSSIPGLGRSPGEAIGYPLQYSWTSLVGSAGKESTCNAGDLGSIPGLGRSPGEGKGSPLQYSDLENSMGCIVHGVTKRRTRLSDFSFIIFKNGYFFLWSESLTYVASCQFHFLTLLSICPFFSLPSSLSLFSLNSFTCESCDIIR